MNLGLDFVSHLPLSDLTALLAALTALVRCLRRQEPARPGRYAERFLRLRGRAATVPNPDRPVDVDDIGPGTIVDGSGCSCGVGLSTLVRLTSALLESRQ